MTCPWIPFAAIVSTLLAGCGATAPALLASGAAPSVPGAKATDSGASDLYGYFYAGARDTANGELQVGLQTAQKGSPWRQSLPNVRVLVNGQPLAADQFAALLPGKDGTLYATQWAYQEAHWGLAPVGARPATGAKTVAYVAIGHFDLARVTMRDLSASLQGLSFPISLNPGAHVTGIVRNRDGSKFLEMTLDQKPASPATPPDLFTSRDLGSAVHTLQP